MIELNEAAAGRPVTAAVGQRLQITLSENATTGYQWQVSGDCGQVLGLEDDRTTAAAGPPGAGAERVWVFSAKAQGHCKLRFVYARSWEKTATGPALVFSVTVQRAT